MCLHRSVAALAVLAILVAGCASREAGKAGSANSAPKPAVARGVALVEWQFPTTVSAELRVHPLEEQLCLDDAHAGLRPALYPQLSEENEKEPAFSLARLVGHSESTYRAYAAGREEFELPVLVNISRETPGALRVLIDRGVRIVSFSVGSKTRLAGIDAVIRDHPEVLFVAATPHIPGNSTGIEVLDERPSVLALRDYPNVILAGSVDYYDGDLDSHRAGRALGTKDTPFHVTSQPAARAARQYFMMTARSTQAFAPGFGGSSAAAAHLAGLLAMIIGHEAERGRGTSPADLLAELDRVTHRAFAREKSGDIHEVSYFTLDTILLNAQRPLVTETIWWGEVSGHPDPVAFRP